MLLLEELLRQRILASQSGNLEKKVEIDVKEYKKKWKEAIEWFQKRVNEDRENDKYPPLSYIVIRQKLCHIKEIDDLRWFYRQCIAYGKTKDKVTGEQNTFSRCFWGALKNKINEKIY